MFGSNSGIQSSWANPQQNQQQQPQQPGGSVFGQPSGFGSGAFGSGGGAFGQPQQPQQPQTNPMFGNLGATSTTPATGSGFGGAFGGGGNTANASNPLFGGAKPATGFGAFGGGSGGTSAFGGGGGFGSTATAQTPTTGGGLFGQGASTGGAFGSTGGVFGAKPATSAFGAAANPQAGAYDGVAPVTSGTANPPYSAFSEKDGPTGINLQYQSISCMPQYRGNSFEELRMQDYQQNRKTAAATTGAFGQPSAFGAAPTQPATGPGLFGQQAQIPQQPANPMFGSFGGTGAAAPATGSAFGASGQTTSTQTGTGNAFGAFGQPQQQQPAQPSSSAFGGFGQTQQQPQQTTGGLFGGGGGFGKPLSSFGGSGAFGGGTTGLFGQTSQQQQPAQPAATGGLFGQTQPSGGAFGGGGAFGTSSTAPKANLFGPPVQQPAASTGFGLLGQQQSQPAQQPAGGLFGTGSGAFGQTTQQQQNQPQQTGGVFGTTQPAQSATGGGLFGGGGGGGLFGASMQQQQQQPNQPPAQTSAFGSFGKPLGAPATGGGLFGGGSFGQPTGTTAGAAQPSTGLFGSTLGQPTTQNATNAFGGGGLFGGNKPTGAILGQSQAAPQPLGGSFFGSSLNTSALGGSTAGTQGGLQASIAQPVTTNLPIFSMLPPAPGTLSQDLPAKKKVTLFDSSSRASTPRAIAYQPAQTQMRGFTSTLRMSTAGNSLSMSLTKPNLLTLNGATGKASDAFGSSSLLGMTPKSSFKKLILDKKVDANELLRRSSASPSPGKASFNPALSVASREKDALTGRIPSPSPALRGKNAQHLIGHFVHETQPPSHNNDIPAELQEGDYETVPSISVLSKLGYEELAEVKKLVVRRIGYGQIEFLEPVDLTTLTKLSDLLGEQVRFDDMECSVYPDSDELDKPPPGSGLNVRARITLYRCWPLDKATRQPIKDEKHPSVVKHLKRLKAMKETEFESFDIARGSWTFLVDHF